MNTAPQNDFTCADTEANNESLAHHMRHEHSNNPLRGYFKEVVFGGVDGIITTFTVVAGFTGAALSTDTTTQLSFLVVLLFGLANLFADAVSMGLGNFLSVRAEKDLFTAARNKELEEIRNNPAAEFDETVYILTTRGFSQHDACALARIYQNNESYWADFMMHHELEMSDPHNENPVFTGFATFASFIVFGSIPLIPFLVIGAGSTADPKTVFMFSVVGTVIALILLGVLKWKIVGITLKRALAEMLIVGGAAAVVAYFIGTLFAG